jgi:hypothetical protein
MPLDLEDVVQLGEGCVVGDIGDEISQTTLDSLTDLNILNPPAADAHEVVMVSPQPLGQLVAGEPRRRKMRGEHSGFLEDGKGPVQRRERNRLADDLAQLGG